MQTVQDVMTAPVMSVELDDSIQSAQSIFRGKRIHHVVVVDRGRAIGVVSDRDILRVLSPFLGHPINERQCDRDTAKHRVHQIMTRRPVTIEPGASLSDAARVLLENRVSCLPVVDESGRLRGILTTKDLLASLLDPGEALHGGGVSQV